MEVFVFGDQACGTQPFLQELVNRRDTPYLLKLFFDRATAAIRVDIANLSRVQRLSIPPLNDIGEFVALYYESTGRSAAVENCLLTISQLAFCICTPSCMGNPSRSTAPIVGIGIGLLSAIAASCSSSQAFPISLAVEAVRVSFRIGNHVDSVLRQLGADSKQFDPCSFYIPHKTTAEVVHALSEYPLLSNLPISRRPYVSETSDVGVSISGFSDVIEDCFKTLDILRGSTASSDRSYGLYHASHLYDIDVVRQISRISDSANNVSFNLPRRLCSSSTGRFYQAESIQDLFEQAARDILLELTNIGAIVSTCESCVTQDQDVYFTLLSPSGPGSSLLSAIQTATERRVTALESLHQLVPSSSDPTSSDKSQSKIAIVGMSGRFPGASDVEEFWEVLRKGRDMHKEVPPDRFDAKAHFDPSGKARNASHTPFGCFIDNAGLFDPRFFNMSPREATQTDPMQRLALITAYEALEMSGFVANRTPSSRLDRVGTFYGQTSDDWREINEAQDIDTYFITGGVRAFGPGRINYHFKFEGPSFSIDTACSSSMAAINVACQSLQTGACDTAVTGGMNVLTNPDIFSGLSKGQFLSKTGPCQTFDQDADGYCRGDGVATIILKRLDDAEADNDNILGVITSVATNHSANAISITHPHAETQAKLYKKVVREAGISPLDISYVEMHGTGTQAGDGCEMKSVTDVFSPPHLQRRMDQPLYLSSVKANVGHGEAVSGVTALVKVLLMLQHNAVPPHAGIKREINRGFPKDLAMRNVHIPLQETPLPRTSGKRQIFVNNFSAAGGNTAIVVEDGPLKRHTGRDTRSTHIITVSARALSSIKACTRRLLQYIDEHPGTDLASLAYTTAARRAHHNYRASFLAKNLQELRDALVGNGDVDVQPVSTSPKVAFTFTGQGSHYARMGANLFEMCDLFQQTLLRFDFIAKGLGYPSILPLISGPDGELVGLSPICIQIGLLCIQMALVELWLSWGVTPDVVIGHSLGEYAALYTAGVLSASDTIYLVGERASLFEKRCVRGSHAMLAVKAPAAELTQVVSTCRVEIACINGPKETVLSGTTAAISMAKDLLQYHGRTATTLNVPYAFHSSQIDEILPEFENAARSIDFKKPNIPFLSPLHGSAQSDTAVDAAYLSRHARETVNYYGAIQSGRTNQIIDESTVWIEIGPHPVSLNFVKSSLGTMPSMGASLRRGEQAWTTLSGTASVLYNSGVNLDWNEFHRDFGDAHQLLNLPAYSWALKNYWIDYRNNWCLTKGDLPAQTVPAIPQPSTTTVHRVVEESFSDTSGYLLAESDIAREDLNSTIQGHIINGTPLCPSTIYSDIGYTVAEYMYRKLWDLALEDSVPGMNIRDMEVPKPLIGTAGVTQILKIEARADKAAKRIEFRLFTGNTDHARCIIDFTDKASWVSEWNRVGYLVQDRIRLLDQRGNDGEVDVLRQGTVYKLFGSFIQYDGPYRGIQKVVYDQENLETTANVIMQPLPEGQSFCVPPYWIDSMGHLAGFTVNCNENLDPQNQVYVSHGWESLRFLKPLLSGGKYRSYVRMLPAEGKVLVGDVYLFEEDTVIAVIGGLKFQCIPRKVLNVLLPPPGGASKSTSATARGLQPAEKVISKIPTHTEHGAPATIVVSRKVGVASQVLDIIAEECGVALSELADANSFVDLGVDSLMQLAISGRMREDIEIDVHSSLFTDHPTIGALKSYLGTLEGNIDGVSDSSETSHVAGTSSNDNSNGETPSTTHTSPDEQEAHLVAEDISQALAKIASQDSVSARIEVNKSQPQEKRNLFDAIDSQMIIPPITAPQRSATSVILQGTPKNAKQQLFIFPDGGGSATSYMDIPRLAKDICVWGLNSPFMKTPHEFTCPLEQIAKIYVTEILRRQPQGPYNVGGWSAGGVVAYEGARQLIAAGHTVTRLILLDAPCPLIIEALPSSLHRWFATIGLLGDGECALDKLPPWLLPHFAASVTALSNYNATPILADKVPETSVIWCEDGVCKLPTDPRPEPYPTGHALFLLENRTDFGPGLWDRFLGGERLRCVNVPGNHFTMMKAPHVERLGEEIQKAFGL